jgi:hypothetical protein
MSLENGGWGKQYGCRLGFQTKEMGHPSGCPLAVNLIF